MLEDPPKESTSSSKCCRYKEKKRLALHSVHTPASTSSLQKEAATVHDFTYMCVCVIYMCASMHVQHLDTGRSPQVPLWKEGFSVAEIDSH